jgi:hypothetical protein
MNMRSNSLLFVLPFVTALTALTAQDPSTGMPNPKTPHHERLAAFAGTWRTESKMAAMPGVPGMEKPTEMAGTEQADLICNGLWLKVAGEGTCGGQDSSGLWMLGYDAIGKTYQCLAVSSMDESICCIDGRYDEKAKVWHFSGDTPMGPFRSEFVFESADRSVEVCYAKGADGKEVQFMRTVRTRVTTPPVDVAKPKPVVAVSAAGTAPSKVLAALQADLGTWDADMKMEMPGAPAMTAKCREVIVPICGGKWSWSDFTGEVMGGPFEGHALVGCDGKTGKVVSFWIDSMNGAWMRTDGTYDEGKQVFTMSGTCYDEQGKRGPVASTSTATGKDSRLFRMVFGEGETQSVMTIAYRRAAK